MLHKILLSAALASASFSVSAGQWHSFEHQAADGKTRPFALYQPDVAQGKRPLLVFLHGAVSGALRDPLAAGKRSKFVPLADKEQFYVLFPAGEKGATWFDEVGSKMVLAQIAQIKRDFAIDENKVFLGGF
ncbi:MAG: phospholipase, partial [Neisseria sp.]|nr:phospholipase [Neisseria sp.]